MNRLTESHLMRVDAHHHLWHYDPVEYDWIDSSMAALQRDFLPLDLAACAAEAHVDAAVAVQARQSMEETDWLLTLAETSPLIRGVVGWAPIASPEFPALLQGLMARPRLKGLRHVVQGEPSGFLDATAFNDGIAAMRHTGLVYDILIFARQLEEATRFVDRHPNQIFVLDHIAKPDIKNLGFAPWNLAMRELARRPNVFCKLSGMVTEADWQTVTPAKLKPYFDAVLEAFTPTRLMAATDWPVCNVACTYAQWWQTLESWLVPLSASECVGITGGVAATVYGLS